MNGPASSGAHRRVVPVLAALVALVLVAAACTGSGGSEPPATTTADAAPAPDPGPTPSSPRDGGVLRIASGSLPADWSPAATVWDTSAQQVGRALYDRLAVYDANGLPRPQLASTIEPNDDFTRWTITLRPGITFQDGTPLDAAAVRANLEAQRTSPVGAEVLAPVAAVSVADPQTVVVTTYTPWSTFPEVLATQVGVIASPATLIAGGATPPVGTGPFMVPAADSPALTTPPLDGGEVRLVRNPAYWQKGLPHLDGVRFLVRPEPAVRAATVVSGEADMVAADRPTELVRLQRAADTGAVRLVEDRNAEKPKVAIALNTAKAPFDQIAARRAVALATDRKQLVELGLDDQGTMARGIVSDTSPWYTDLPEPVPDTNRAKDEVASYTKEFARPVTTELLVPQDPFLLYQAALWRAQQAKVGVDVTLKPVTAAELADLTRRGQFQAAMLIDFTSPHPDLYEPLLRGVPAEQPSVNANITRYVNPKVTEALTDARSTSDVALQVDDYRIVQETLFLDVPWLFLVQLRQAVAVAPQVRDVSTWATAAGERGLGQDGATVNLAQVWLERPTGGAGTSTTSTTPPTSTTAPAGQEAAG